MPKSHELAQLESARKGGSYTLYLEVLTAISITTYPQHSGLLSVVSKGVRLRSIPIEQKQNPQSFRCPSCKRSSIAIELKYFCPASNQ